MQNNEPAKAFQATRPPQSCRLFEKSPSRIRGPDHADYGTHLSLNIAWRRGRGDGTVPLKVKTQPSPTH